jgi:peptidoglycan hydrolase CwlO-like protein
METETILWTGGAASGSAIISYLLKRAIDQVDRKLTELSKDTNSNTKDISEVKLDIAKNYVSNDDFEKQMQAQLKPLAEGIKDLKEDLRDFTKGIKDEIKAIAQPQPKR